MRLFVIEGVDGAGKSTQIRMLQDFFTKLGYKNEYLHFPRTDAPYFGELIARFLRGEFGSLNDVDPYLVAMLYAGDRRDASEMLARWLRDGKVVLLDRYTYSNIAYQCAKLINQEERDRLREWILELEFSHFGIPKPDLNIFLDVPFSFTEKKLTAERSGRDREYLRGIRDIHEDSLAFQRTVRNIYLDVARNDGSLAFIDCSDGKGNMLPPSVIFENIISTLRKRNFI